jgi:uncharacterized protein with von Willebrand factor type A (vWA) domain
MMDRASVYEDFVAFVRRLREANVIVGVDQTEAFARALDLVDPLSTRGLYLAARATLVTRREDMPVFDAVFDAFWHARDRSSARKAPLAPRHDTTRFQRTALASFMSEKAKPAAPEVEVSNRAKAPSDIERLQTKDFSDLTADERQALEKAIAELRLRPAMRRSRRRVPSRTGALLDMRRVLRAASRRGGAAISLFFEARKVKRRPIVVLADISGSMELYTRVLLQFFHALTRVHGACETFVFGTRLTCITSALRLRDVDQAIDAAAAEIADFAGGTRIGESFHAFGRLHAPRVLRRGAVLIVVSDGWERGDAGRLASELGRLRARCHRIIWLNPLLGHAGYEPLAAGMAAALPFLDDFLPLNDLKSVTSLSAHLATLPARKGFRGGGPKDEARR